MFRVWLTAALIAIPLGASAQRSTLSDDDVARWAALLRIEDARLPDSVVVMRAIWVVFDNSNKRLSTFPFKEKKDAESFLEKKQEEKKGTCYMQLVKEELKEVKV